MCANYVSISLSVSSTTNLRSIHTSQVFDLFWYGVQWNFSHLCLEIRSQSWWWWWCLVLPFFGLCCPPSTHYRWLAINSLLLVSFFVLPAFSGCLGLARQTARALFKTQRSFSVPSTKESKHLDDTKVIALVLFLFWIPFLCVLSFLYHMVHPQKLSHHILHRVLLYCSPSPPCSANPMRFIRVVRCEDNVAGSICSKWRTCIKHYSVAGAKRTSFSKQRKQHPVGSGCADGLFHTSIGIDCACHPCEVQHGRGGNTHLVSVFGRRGRCLPESISGYVYKSSLVI